MISQHISVSYPLLPDIITICRSHDNDTKENIYGEWELQKFIKSSYDDSPETIIMPKEEEKITIGKISDYSAKLNIYGTDVAISVGGDTFAYIADDVNKTTYSYGFLDGNILTINTIADNNGKVEVTSKLYTRHGTSVGDYCYNFDLKAGDTFEGRSIYAFKNYDPIEGPEADGWKVKIDKTENGFMFYTMSFPNGEHIVKTISVPIGDGWQKNAAVIDDGRVLINDLTPFKDGIILSSVAARDDGLASVILTLSKNGSEIPSVPDLDGNVFFGKQQSVLNFDTKPDKDFSILIEQIDGCPVVSAECLFSDDRSDWIMLIVPTPDDEYRLSVISAFTEDKQSYIGQYNGIMSTDLDEMHIHCFASQTDSENILTGCVKVKNVTPKDGGKDLLGTYVTELTYTADPSETLPVSKSKERIILEIESVNNRIVMGAFNDEKFIGTYNNDLITFNLKINEDFGTADGTYTLSKNENGLWLSCVESYEGWYSASYAQFVPLLGSTNTELPVSDTPGFIKGDVWKSYDAYYCKNNTISQLDAKSFTYTVKNVQDGFVFVDVTCSGSPSFNYSCVLVPINGLVYKSIGADANGNIIVDDVGISPAGYMSVTSVDYDYSGVWSWAAYYSKDGKEYQPKEWGLKDRSYEGFAMIADEAGEHSLHKVHVKFNDEYKSMLLAVSKSEAVELNGDLTLIAHPTKDDMVLRSVNYWEGGYAVGTVTFNGDHSEMYITFDVAADDGLSYSVSETLFMK